MRVVLLVACAFVASVGLARLTDAASGQAPLGWDETSLLIDGKREFLISGEFHYFRVPKDAWRTRLHQLKAIGGNCVATYIPWGIHEPEEGRYLFGDCPQRDLDAFLKVVQEEGLMAMVRPGPYQYSELVYHGLPRWLIEGHPEIAKKHKDGKPVRLASVDYNHPYFLEKTRAYFKAVADVIRPHMAANGGCIALVQLDNEMTGIHTWFGYQPSVEYYERCADYLAELRGYLREFGIGGPVCHNAGGAMMSASYAPCVRKLGTSEFMMGYDHYYNLGTSFSDYNPTVGHFLTALFACDVMRAYGYPPVGLEIQTGTIGDYPPILKEDLLACHMTDLAAGLKGVNFYVFTGGPNMPGTGNTVDVYDYSAPVAADGTERPNYESLKAFGAFVKAHPELIEAERLSSVRLGFEWTHFAGCAKFDRQFMKTGVASALLRSSCSFEHFPLEGGLDASKPLVLAGIESMSEGVQRKVAAFVRDGGSLLVAPDFPRTDESGRPCAVLAEAVGAPATKSLGEPTREDPVCRAGTLRVYGLTPRRLFGMLPSGGTPTLVSEDGQRVYGCRWPAGKGLVSQLGATWSAKFFLQSDMLANELAALGAKTVVESSNRNVLTTAYRLKDGSLGVFALNLQSSPQETTIRVPNGTSHRFALKAMEVGYAK